MKKKLMICVIGLATFRVFGQDAIRNGNLETISNSPSVQQIDQQHVASQFPTYWYPPTGGSPDAFSSANPTCSPWTTSPCYPQLCTWANKFGQENPHSGNVMMGANITGEFLQTQLNPSAGYYPNGLAAGACYRLTVHVSRADLAGFHAPIQAVLSTTNLVDMNNTGPMVIPAGTLKLTTPISITPKVGWTQIIYDFRALGGEKYLTLGLFDTGLQSAETTPGSCDATGNNACTNCAVPNTIYYYFDDISLVPVANNFTPDLVFTNANPNITASQSGKNILISGNVNIASNVTFTNCHIRCNTGSTITVNNNQVFTLSGTDIKGGCGYMWQGIRVNPGATISMSAASSIEDAIIAVECDNAIWQIQNSTFSKNERDIVLKNNNVNSSAFYIKGVTFNDDQYLAGPAYGYQGKTISAIKAYGTLMSNSMPITVGGTNTGDGCTFKGGQYGIQSDRCDMNVLQSTFENVLVTGIDFMETTPGQNSRTLNVTNGCNFKNTTTQAYMADGIFAHNRVNLKVQGNQFNHLSAAVKWYDNPNRNLTVGDPANTSLGNTITGCLFGIVGYGNKTTAGTATMFSSNNPTGSGYTNILIANNLIYGVLGKQTYMGILLSEYSLGSDAAYYTLDIRSNFFSQVTNGIQLERVNGWGNFLYYLGNSNNYVKSQLLNNFVSLNTNYMPYEYAFMVNNSPGLNITANGVSSDAPSNWQNYGIFFQNSERCRLIGNAIQAGTGIVGAGVIFNSDILCNSLSGNSCGINLANSQLRYVNGLHGSTGAGGAFVNYFTGPTIPWGINMQNYYSPNNQNKWVWDNTATSTYPKLWNSSTGSFETNLTATSVITNITGTNNCIYFPVYGGNIFSTPYASGSNATSTWSDPVQQWIANYNYHVGYLVTGQGNGTHAAASIRDMIDIENAIGSEMYSDAEALLAAYTPGTTVEQNFKDVLQIMLDVNFPESREVTTAEKAALVTIANQDPLTGGPAVEIARSYLTAYFGMFFSKPDYTSPKITGTATIVTPCNLSPVSGTVITLADENNNVLPITGATIEADGSFSFDPYQMMYYKGLYPNTNYRMVSAEGSRYTVLNQDYMKISDWIIASPLEVDLGGVVVLTDTIIVDPDTGYTEVTSIYDGNGNFYEVITEGEGNTDIVVSKYSPNSELLWRQVYAGAAGGDDIGTCINLDADANVYVGGKVWNTDYYDYVLIKYNTDGNLQWIGYSADVTESLNEPTGIKIDATSLDVSITGVHTTADKVKYRTVVFAQCLQSGGNQMEQEQQQNFVSVLQQDIATYYPNPTDGNLTVELKDETGVRVELYNFAGKMVYSTQLNKSGTINLPVNEVAAGIYLIKFTGNSGKVQFSKVVLHRGK